MQPGPALVMGHLPLCVTPVLIVTHVVPSSHSVSSIFKHAVQVNAVTPLTRYRLQTLVNTREADLTRATSIDTITDMEKYAEGTASQLLYLQVLHITANPCVAHMQALYAFKSWCPYGMDAIWTLATANKCCNGVVVS